MKGNPTTLSPILYTRQPVPRVILLRCVGLTLGFCSVRCYDVKCKSKESRRSVDAYKRTVV